MSVVPRDSGGGLYPRRCDSTSGAAARQTRYPADAWIASVGTGEARDFTGYWAVVKKSHQVERVAHAGPVKFGLKRAGTGLPELVLRGRWYAMHLLPEQDCA